MTKLALQADLCYNEALNIVCPGDVATIPGRDERKASFFRMDTIPQKQCSACHNLFPATPEYFSRNAKNKGGLNGRCKACIKKYNARPDVKERYRATTKEYNARPEVRERNRLRDRERHRSPNRQAWLQDYNNRPETIERERAYMEVYRQEYYSQPENKEHKRVTDNHYHKTHVERHRELGRVAQHQRRAKKSTIAGTHTPEQIQDLLKRQKHKCYYCSAKFEKRKGKYIYHIDHTFPINRVAGTDIPANDISYLVLACPKCNISKSDKFPWEWHQGGRLL